MAPSKRKASLGRLEQIKRRKEDSASAPNGTAAFEKVRSRQLSNAQKNQTRKSKGLANGAKKAREMSDESSKDEGSQSTSEEGSETSLERRTSGSDGNGGSSGSDISSDSQAGASSGRSASEGNALSGSEADGDSMEDSESADSGESSQSEPDEDLAEKREALKAALAAAQMVMKTDVRAGVEILKAAAKLAEEIDEVEKKEGNSESSQSEQSDMSEEKADESDSPGGSSEDSEKDESSSEESEPKEASDASEDESGASENSKDPRNLASEFERALSEDEESSGTDPDKDDSADLSKDISGDESGSEFDESESKHEEGSDTGEESSQEEDAEMAPSEGVEVDTDSEAAVGKEHDGGKEAGLELGKRKERDESNVQGGTMQVDPKRCYVGGMPFNTTEDDIHQYFGECGTIADLDFCTFPDTGKFNGICFITFKTEVAAKRAQALDGAEMGGRFLKVAPCKPKTTNEAKRPKYEAPPPRDPSSLRAYIGNLDWNIDEAILRDFFSGCNIRSVKWAEDKETGRFKGYGHVDFEDEDSLEKAVTKNQELCLGRPMKVAYAVANKAPGGGPAAAKSGGVEKHAKSCFVCGADGHKSFECPTKGETEKPARKNPGACFVCGEEGHKSFECPTKRATKRSDEEEENTDVQETAAAAVGSACFVCGEEGHRSYECPTKLKRAAPIGQPQGDTCFECGQAGHKSYQCPSKKAGGKGGEATGGQKAANETCFACGQSGHKSYECPSKQNGKVAVDEPKVMARKVDKSSDACFVCGQEGHKSYQCPQKQKKVAEPVEEVIEPAESKEVAEPTEANGVKLDKSVDACFVCSRPGHKSFQCPLKPKRECKKV